MTQRLPKQRQTKAIWQHTAALLMEAEATGKPDDLHHATGQLHRALDAEGWVQHKHATEAQVSRDCSPSNRWRHRCRNLPIAAVTGIGIESACAVARRVLPWT